MMFDASNGHRINHEKPCLSIITSSETCSSIVFLAPFQVYACLHVFTAFIVICKNTVSPQWNNKNNTANTVGIQPPPTQNTIFRGFLHIGAKTVAFVMLFTIHVPKHPLIACCCCTFPTSTKRMWHCERFVIYNLRNGGFSTRLTACWEAACLSYINSRYTPWLLLQRNNGYGNSPLKANKKDCQPSTKTHIGAGLEATPKNGQMGRC